jgi:hypothetical protein
VTVSTKVWKETHPQVNHQLVLGTGVLTSIDLFCGDFVKDNVYVPPLSTTLHELKTRIREACTNTDQEILHNVWQEVEYRFDVAQATRGAHTELY